MTASCTGKSARPVAPAPEPIASTVVDTFFNFDPTLTPDGSHVVFASNRDGVWQVYVAGTSGPGSPPRQLTKGPERAMFPRATRDGRSVVFLRDENGDENFRLYAVDLDGSHERALTPGPVLHRRVPIEPRDRAGTFVYVQQEATSPASQVAVLSAGGGEPAVVYTDPSPVDLTDVSPDGSHALLVRWVSSSDLVALEVDLAAGTARTIYPMTADKVVVHDARYSADGSRILVSADDAEEHHEVLALDARTGQVAASFQQSEPPSAQIDQVAVSPRGDAVAIAINAGDHVELRVLDATTLAPRVKGALPLGFVELSRFSDDGRSVVFTMSTPAAPTDVYSMDTATGAARPIRSELNASLSRLPAIVASIEHVRAFDGLDLPVNLYLPADHPARRPVIVWFHGGPADHETLRFGTFARFFTALGYAFAEPNVRGSTGFGRAFEMADDREKRADWLRDLESVNAWARAQPWADPSKIVAMGESYGGYTVLMALTRQPTLWSAGVDLYGPADMVTALQSTDARIRAAFVQEFGDVVNDRALLERFSPLRDADKIVAPLFVYAGAHDPRVPRSESDQIVGAARNRHVPVEYMVAANEGHSLVHRENRIEMLTRVARFLEAHMR